MKKGKIQYDATMKSIDTMMPDELRDDTKRALEACKDVSIGIKDHCESSFTMIKCIFKENPNFFFP
jgi:PBP/GOBP family